MAINNETLQVGTSEGWLWDAASRIRGVIDAPKYKDEMDNVHGNIDPALQSHLCAASDEARILKRRFIVLFGPGGGLYAVSPVSARESRRRKVLQ